MKFINNVIFVRAGEDISRGDLVIIVEDSGQKAYRSDSENGRPAMGYAIYNIASGTVGKIILNGGIVNDISDVEGNPLVADGTPYYIAGGDSPDGRGKVSTIPGTLIQFAGFALTDSILMFVVGPPNP